MFCYTLRGWYSNIIMLNTMNIIIFKLLLLLYNILIRNIFNSVNKTFNDFRHLILAAALDFFNL